MTLSRLLLKPLEKWTLVNEEHKVFKKKTRSNLKNKIFEENTRSGNTDQHCQTIATFLKLLSTNSCVTGDFFKPLRLLVLTLVHLVVALVSEFLLHLRLRDEQQLAVDARCTRSQHALCKAAFGPLLLFRRRNHERRRVWRIQEVWVHCELSVGLMRRVLCRVALAAVDRRRRQHVPCNLLAILRKQEWFGHTRDISRTQVGGSLVW